MTDQIINPIVQHNPDASRFELFLDGSLAVLDYSLQEDIITFIHTGVPTALEGRGIGSQLVFAGLEYARDNSFQVVPVCWFVAGYIKRHPEYHDLVKN